MSDEARRAGGGAGDDGGKAGIGWGEAWASQPPSAAMVRLRQRLGAAAYIATLGPVNTGIGTADKLMYPLKYYDQRDQYCVAAKILSYTLIALLECLPPARIEQIETEIAEFLDGFPIQQRLRDIARSQAVESPPRE